MSYTIIQGDNRETLKTIPDNSIDSIVTDPPYGIDFLGKAWDANTGALETYQECLRVLKPGGHILAFSAARTYHHLAITLEQAGFEIRDQIMWIYSSGFPKSQDIGKQLNKKAIANEWSGWGTSLKPAHEPIALARKPIKLSIAKNAQKYGTGALNIDAARIPYESEEDLNTYLNNIAGPMERSKAEDGDNIKMHEGKTGFKVQKGKVKRPSAGKRTANFSDSPAFGGEAVSGGVTEEEWTHNAGGRFPSNVIGEILQADYQKYFYCPKVSRKERHIGFDNNTVKTYKEMILDMGGIYVDSQGNEQSIDLPSKDIKLPQGYIKAHSLKDHYEKWCLTQSSIMDKGNNHPTVKPIELMKYLIKLITPPGGTVLDPFNGSGSTGCAAVELGHDYIGCELDPAYVDIANKRIAAWLAKDEPLVSETFANLFEEE